jgi:parallel beta-helix repeat protein
VIALAPGSTRGADVFLVDADDVTIEGFRIRGARRNKEIDSSSTEGAGVAVAPGRSGCRVLRNEIFDNTFGVVVQAATDCTVASNSIHDNVAENAAGEFDPSGGVGVTVFTFEPSDSLAGFDVSLNRISGNDRQGIFAGKLGDGGAVSAVTVTRNRSERNGLDPAKGGNGDARHGIEAFLVTGPGNVFSKNKTAGNGLSGFSTIQCAGLLLERNTSKQNGAHGFRSLSDDGCAFRRNKATPNAADGFVVQDLGPPSRNLVLECNRTAGNGSVGFRDTSTGTGTAGTANAYERNVCGEKAPADSVPPGLCR